MTEDAIKWHCRTELRKFEGDSTDEADLLEEPTVIEGNALTTAGSTILWTALTGGTYTAFNGTNACIGVGDSSTATTVGMTNLQASTNKLRKTVSPAPSISGNQATFVASFGTSEANYAWNEWGIFNNTTDASGTMLNRKVESLGTKAVNSTWQLTVTLTIA